MQHAGLQYGQGAANSHQSPTFSHTAGGTTTSSLRQFRKKDGAEKSSTDLNTSIENTHIARVAPHNYQPARTNDYYRYQHQYPDYNVPFKETPTPVKYSEIAETPQNVDHTSSKHKDYMEMCSISQQPHIKQNYVGGDALPRQQPYPPLDGASVHHQYPHHAYKAPESQYAPQYQMGKYGGTPPQCRKYVPPPPPPENDFLAKLQRIHPTMARSIMSEHHIRDAGQAPTGYDQRNMYGGAAQNHQRYYPPVGQPYNYQYNYPSCNYKPEYRGGGQAPFGGAGNGERLSPRSLGMMNYGGGQKVSPNYGQAYNAAPEYAQHYQHRRAVPPPQDYYQQAPPNCRPTPYIASHQISPNDGDNRASSSGLRHFIENWAEEDPANEIAPIFKENIRLHGTDPNNEQVFVINAPDIAQCLENVSLVPTENGQYILKAHTEGSASKEKERTVSVQILEAPPKTDCMVVEEAPKENEDLPQTTNEKKDCDDNPKSDQTLEEVTSNEVSVIKDMPIIEEATEETAKETEENDTVTKKSQKSFSVDDIMNNIGASPNESRKDSLKEPEESEEVADDEDTEVRNYISVSDDNVILEIGGVLLELTINQSNGNKVLSVHSLSPESLLIDFNGNYQDKNEETEKEEQEVIATDQEENVEEDKFEELVDDVFLDEVVIGEEVVEETEVVSLEEVEEKVSEEEPITEISEQEPITEVLGQEPIKEVSEEDTIKEVSETEPIREVSEHEVIKEVSEQEPVKTLVEQEPIKKVSEEEPIKSVEEKPLQPVKKHRRKSDEKKKYKRIKEHKPKKEESREKKKRLSILADDVKLKKLERRMTAQSGVEESENKKVVASDSATKSLKKTKKPKTINEKESTKVKKSDTKPLTPENVIEEKKSEEVKKEAEKMPTKAAKKSYPEEQKTNLEEIVNKVKSLKAYSAEAVKLKTSLKDGKIKTVKKVTFNLEAEVREIKDDIDKRKLSWEEYHSRKRKSPTAMDDSSKPKIMEDTVTSSNDVTDVVDQVSQSIEDAMKHQEVVPLPMRAPPSPQMTCSNWETDTPSPPSPVKPEVVTTTHRKCVIDVNEFNIKPIESVQTPSPVSSSQFSYSEDDTLQVYKDVVDSKLNSLSIKIPRPAKSLDRCAILLNRFLNKGTLNCEELEEVKKFIEIKRKMLEEEKDRPYKSVKMHFKKRKKRRFRNLYAEETSSASDSSDTTQVGTGGDYSVYQRDSQGVPKLIIKRNSGIPQPFVKLERSQAVELMAKKRKLY